MVIIGIIIIILLILINGKLATVCENQAKQTEFILRELKKLNKSS